MTSVTQEEQQPEGREFPWWVRAIKWIGVVPAIAIGLTGLMAFTMRNDVKEARDTSVEIKAAIVQHAADNKDIAREQKDMFREMLRLLSLICSGQRPHDAAPCFDPQSRP